MIPEILVFWLTNFVTLNTRKMNDHMKEVFHYITSLLVKAKVADALNCQKIRIGPKHLDKSISYLNVLFCLMKSNI